MGRPLRFDQGGYVYHVLNRANADLVVFRKDEDYEAFLRVLQLALEHVPGMRLLAYCLMPNHWHMVLWPQLDGELSDFCHWLTLTHTQRWHAHYRNVGRGHLYQGRYKSFPIAEDEHYLSVCRYVERNALRAGLTTKAELWPYGSLSLRAGIRKMGPTLADGPVTLPRTWVSQVNRPQTEAELEALRRCVQRGQPYGAAAWVERTAKELGLQSTLVARGRPRKEATEKGS
jgi:putative transposase